MACVVGNGTPCLPENCRRACLSCLLTEQESAVLRRVDGFFELLNIDSEPLAKCLPCCFEDRITAAEMTALRAVLEKTWWSADDFTSVISSLFSSGQASRPDGWELVKVMVEELRAVKQEGTELTRWQVNNAMMTAVSRYATSAMDQMKAVILKEYEALGVSVHAIKVQQGAPENADMTR